MRKAVIDVGSNSVLLVVAEKIGDHWRQVFESSTVTGLGEGVKKTGLIAEPGMTRTLEAIKQAFDRAQEMNADSIVAAATMAARIATNAQSFLDKAKAQSTPVVVLSGEREAELGFLAVANDPLFAQIPTLSIIDPGGQSTEIVVAQRDREAGSSNWNVLFRKSFSIGTLGLRSGVLSDETPSSAARLQACKELDDAIGVISVDSAGETVALGASATNLVTVRDRIAEWDPDRVHGSTLLYEDIGLLVGKLCDLSDDERAGLVGLEKGRERTIHIGALILERALHALNNDRCRVSVRGWRHALLEEAE